MHTLLIAAHKIVTTVYPEILAGIKFGGWAPNRHCKNIGSFKFGGSVRDSHTYDYICKYSGVLEGGYEIINLPCEFCAYQCTSLWACPHTVTVLKQQITGSLRDLRLKH